MWFKVDDGFAFNSKVVRAGDAVALWVRAGAWCARELNDGNVPDEMLALLGDRVPDSGGLSHAQTLASVGLWKRTRSGYVFHDWGVYNPSSDEAKAKRDSESMGGSVGNHRRWHVGKGQVKDGCPYCEREKEKPSPPRSGTRSRKPRVPDRGPESGASRPSRPVPSRPNTSTSDDAVVAVDVDEPGTDLAVATLPTPGHLVAAWIDGYRLGQGKEPTPALLGRVKGKAKELAKGLDLEGMREAWQVCKSAGSEGTWDVVSYRPRATAVRNPNQKGNYALEIAAQLRSQGL